MTKSNHKSFNSSPEHSCWLITGGCGFIGRNLIKYLTQEDGYQIRILDNLSVGTREDLKQICNFREFRKFSAKSDVNNEKMSSLPELSVGDIRDYDLCLNCCKDIDIVVHLAANTGVELSVENPRKDMESNVIGTLNMLEAARENNVKRFIFASSGAPIGECEPPIHEELAPHPVSPYGASKLAGEGYCSVYYRTYGLETVVLRFGNAYGPLSGRKNSVIAKFMKQVLDGETLEIYGDGNQTRDFIYIDDLIKAIHVAGVKDDIGGETFQIATNKEHTINELVDILLGNLAAFGFKNVVVNQGKPRLGDIRRNFSDTSKAWRRLQWRAHVEIHEGIKRTINWYLS